MRRGIGVIILFGCVALFGCDEPQHPQQFPPVVMAGDEWTFIQLTDNEFFDGEASIDGDMVVWVSRERWSRSPDIYLYDGQTTRALTTDGQENRNPKISEGYVVWEAEGDCTDAEGRTRWAKHLKHYDGQTIRPIPGSARAVTYDISGPRVAWAAKGINGELDVFLFDGQRTQRVSSNPHTDEYPSISGSNVAWRGWDGTRWRIYLFDGERTRAISGDDGHCFSPKISARYVTWTAAHPGEDTEVFFYDGRTIVQLTENSENDPCPAIDGSAVTWSGFDGNDREVFLFDGETVTQITDNDYDDGSPVIDGGQMAWTGSVLSTREGTEVFFYDGNVVTRLTNNNVPDYVNGISGSKVRMTFHDGNDREIVLAVRTDQE